MLLRRSAGLFRGLARGARANSTVGAVLEAQAAAVPTKNALLVAHQNVSWTTGDLNAHADAFAAGLIEFGFQKGDALAAALHDDAELIVATYACAKAGVVLHALPPAAHTADAVASVLAGSGARGLLLAGGAAGAPLRDAVREELAPELAAQGRLGVQGQALRSARFPALRVAIKTGTTWEHPVLNFHDAMVFAPQPDPLPRRALEIQPDDAVAVYYGDDGAAAQTATHAGLLAAAAKAGDALGLTGADAVCATSGAAALAVGTLAAVRSLARCVVPAPGPDAAAVAAALGGGAAGGEACSALLTSDRALGQCARVADAAL